jgi:hypothetical protein
MRVLALCALAFMTMEHASASDCGTSKEFKVNGSQAFAGVLRDPANFPIPGLVLELVGDKTVKRSLGTDNEGRFDLGRLPAGSYRLRIVSEPFCAPTIQCGGVACNVAGTLRINEKKAKPVIVE